MRLAFDIDSNDFYNLEGLKKLDYIFLEFLKNASNQLYRTLLNLREKPILGNSLDYSEFLIKAAPIIDDFLAKLFNIERENSLLRQQHQEYSIIYECKRQFVNRIALKKYDLKSIEKLNLLNISSYLEKQLGQDFDIKTLATKIMLWLQDDKRFAYELNMAAQYCALMTYNKNSEILFQFPLKVNPLNNINKDIINRYKTRLRNNFNFFAPEFNFLQALNESKYCILCHKQGKDSCSRGIKNDISKMGCPLKQKISEMNTMKSLGFNLGALAIIMIDNPMLAATGYRICNDCSKACIYQKQEPVDVPLIESNILEEILNLPYGVEIYWLLTNWNPLNISQPLPKKSTNYRVLVAGLGPAGFSLSYYLMQKGHSIVAIDGLKINPLSFNVYENIKCWKKFMTKLNPRLPDGFGGVMEYGITPRWNKDKLTLIRLILERRNNFKLYGGISLEQNITIKQSLKLGFDHIAVCTGSKNPNVPNIKNISAKGVKTATDILMSIQSNGAFIKNSTTNLLVRMPIIVIGCGLTAIDVSIETLLYYKVQVINFFYKYKKSLKKNGEKNTTKYWTEEDKSISQEFINHAKLFIKAEKQNSLEKIFRKLGGVKICYHKNLTESQAYKNNVNEIMQAIAYGINFVENMKPISINVDKHNYAESITFDCLNKKHTIKARTVIFALGNKKNTIDHNQYYSEYTQDTLNKITLCGDANSSEINGSVVNAINDSKKQSVIIDEKLLKNKPFSFFDNKRFLLYFSKLISSVVKNVNILSQNYTEITIESPLAVSNFKPGHFFRLQNYSNDIRKIMKPLAITGINVNYENNLINFVIYNNGNSSGLCRTLKINEKIVLMGPCGSPSTLAKNSRVVLIGIGIGNANFCAIGDSLKKNNCKIIYFAGYKKSEDRFYQKEIESFADIIIWSCEEGILSKNRKEDFSFKGNIINVFKKFLSKKLQEKIDIIMTSNVNNMAIQVEKIKNKFAPSIPLIVNLNTPMQCMMGGVCGRCIQKINGNGHYIFACTSQEAKSETIDFQGLKCRLEQNSLLEKI